MVGGSTEGLGNGDQINIWDDAGDLVDRLTYDDTPRSRDNSVVPKTVADLGANLYDNWELSNASNDPGSITVDQVAGALDLDRQPGHERVRRRRPGGAGLCRSASPSSATSCGTSARPSSWS